jgi:hypothetical protein
MQLSFLSNCDDVSLPALKLDPDTEIARVVPADVEVRQRAVLHDVEVMTASVGVSVYGAPAGGLNAMNLPRRSAFGAGGGGEGSPISCRKHRTWPI